MKGIHLRAALVLSAALIVTGCASGYGNYSSATPLASSSMADNTVSQLAALYPPGRTTFAMQQPTDDAFGASLVQRLRARGYAVEEFTKDGQSQNATPIGYVLNTVAPNLYQVTTYVRGISLTRGFVVATDGKAYPAGPWTREE